MRQFPLIQLSNLLIFLPNSVVSWQIMPFVWEEPKSANIWPQRQAAFLFILKHPTCAEVKQLWRGGEVRNIILRVNKGFAPITLARISNGKCHQIPTHSRMGLMYQLTDSRHKLAMFAQLLLISGHNVGKHSCSLVKRFYVFRGWGYHELCRPRGFLVACGWCHKSDMTSLK